VISVPCQFIGFESLLIKVDEPVVGNLMPGIELSLGEAVRPSSGGGEDLNDETRRPLDEQPCSFHLSQTPSRAPALENPLFVPLFQRGREGDLPWLAESTGYRLQKKRHEPKFKNAK